MVVGWDVVGCDVGGCLLLEYVVDELLCELVVFMKGIAIFKFCISILLITGVTLGTILMLLNVSMVTP